MNKKPEVTAATRQRIIDAFWECYTRLPAEKITVNMIVERAGIHRSSFYRYFADVYEVLKDSQDELIDSMRSESRRMRRMTDFTSPEYMNMIADILTGHAGRLHRCLEDSRFREHFIEVFRPEIEESLSLDPSHPGADYLTFFLISALIVNFDYWYDHRDSLSLYDISAMGQELFLGGISRFMR